MRSNIFRMDIFIMVEAFRFAANFRKLSSDSLTHFEEQRFSFSAIPKPNENEVAFDVKWEKKKTRNKHDI